MIHIILSTSWQAAKWRDLLPWKKDKKYPLDSAADYVTSEANPLCTMYGKWYADYSFNDIAAIQEFLEVWYDNPPRHSNRYFLKLAEETAERLNRLHRKLYNKDDMHYARVRELLDVIL